MENNLTKEQKDLVELLDKGEKLVAMVAPSFPVDFSHCNLLGMLKRLGFDKLFEVTRGAIETNNQLLDLMKKNPGKRYITGPCPNVVRVIRNKYPQLQQYIAPIDSPMSASAKLCIEEFPDHKRVFVGPCLAKKLEAKEDCPDLEILVVTYKELHDIFDLKGIKPEENDLPHRQAGYKTDWDVKGVGTQLYPISGGLAQSSCLDEKLTDPEMDIVSGPKLVMQFLEEFEKEKKGVQLLDILSCDGGCINGPGVMTKESLSVRRQKVVDYWKNIAKCG